MSPTPIRTIDDLLTEVALEHLRSCLWAPLGHSLFEWDRALSESRPDFLYQLKACGVTVLKERQALSNALSQLHANIKLLLSRPLPRRGQRMLHVSICAATPLRLCEALGFRAHRSPPPTVPTLS